MVLGLGDDAGGGEGGGVRDGGYVCYTVGVHRFFSEALVTRGA